MGNYGEAIHALRKKSNMTQAELGDKMNVSYQAVSKWENNLSQPDFDTVQKLAILFKISVNDFINLANDNAGGDNENGGQGEVAAANACEAAPAPEVMLGVCTKCGRTVFNSNLGEDTPQLMCKDCIEKRENNNKARLKYIELNKAVLRGEKHHKVKLSYIIGALVAALACALGIYLGLSQELSQSGKIILPLVLAVLAFTYTTQMFWDGAVYNLTEDSIGRSISMPGVIFSWDMDSIIFAIAIKLLFGLLSILFSIIVFLGGVVLSIIISPVTFFFALSRIIKNADDVTFETRRPIYESMGRTRKIIDYEEPEADYVALVKSFVSDKKYLKYGKQYESSK